MTDLVDTVHAPAPVEPEVRPHLSPRGVRSLAEDLDRRRLRAGNRPVLIPQDLAQALSDELHAALRAAPSPAPVEDGEREDGKDVTRSLHRYRELAIRRYMHTRLSYYEAEEFGRLHDNLAAALRAAQPERVRALEEYYVASEAYHYDLSAPDSREAWERLDRARRALAALSPAPAAGEAPNA